MNNNSKNKNRGGKNSGQGGKHSWQTGKNWKKGNVSKQQRNKNHGRERHFKKFIDTERVNNESNCWPRDNWNFDNSGINNFNPNEPDAAAGIFPWIRNKPCNNLIIPQDINFDEQYKSKQEEIGLNVINNVSKHLRNKNNHGGKRHFQKFIDSERVNKASNSWPQDNWNFDNNGINNFNPNEPVAAAGTFPSIRNEPCNNLITPQHINFDEQYESKQEEIGLNVINNVHHREPEITKETTKINQENVPKSDNVSKSENPKSELSKCSALPLKSKISDNINKNIYLINLKQEKRSSSSSSSSSESSSESEPVPNSKASIMSEKTLDSKSPSSPLGIKLKPRTKSVASTPAKKTNKSVQQTSSSSSSSSDEESTPPRSKNKLKPQVLIKSESTNKKVNSEEDVVCVGNLENKVVLEDETDKSNTEDESESKNPALIFNKLSKNNTEKTSEKCMICDKNGHTSFQCQMICKNCSEPYHGYRTCPHPANLNTMLQIFMEFCMQQMQHFQVEKQTGAGNCDNVPKRNIGDKHVTSAVNKSNKLKRKHVKANESNKRHKTTKKRKVSASKKSNSKSKRNESNDDDSDDSSDTGTSSSTENDENISDSSDENLVSSKRKRKLKRKNAFKANRDLSSFAAKPLNLPMVLNGFPNLTVPTTTSVQNPHTSANALNTLFLTQMFQNAIDSLKK